MGETDEEILVDINGVVHILLKTYSSILKLTDDFSLKYWLPPQIMSAI